MTFRYIPSHSKKDMKSPKEYYVMLDMIYNKPTYRPQVNEIFSYIHNIWGVSTDEADWLVEFLKQDLSLVRTEMKIFEDEYPEYIL